MRILFWNTGCRPVTALLRDVCRLRGVDILVLAELAGPRDELLEQLNEDSEQTYFVAQKRLPKATRRKLHIFSRLPEDRLDDLEDDAGIAVRHVFPVLGPDFILVAVHLRSKLFQEAGDQALSAIRVSSDVCRIESQVGHRRTIIVGDFNMNPFETGLVAADAFHAVMSRRIAARKVRKVEDHKRYYFYNPIWNHFGDHPPSPPGSYYRARSGQSTYYWNLFDQVLIRPDLLEYFRG